MLVALRGGNDVKIEKWHARALNGNYALCYVGLWSTDESFS